jgi:hypothetical protein
MIKTMRLMTMTRFNREPDDARADRERVWRERWTERGKKKKERERERKDWDYVKKSISQDRERWETRRLEGGRRGDEKKKNKKKKRRMRRKRDNTHTNWRPIEGRWSWDDSKEAHSATVGMEKPSDD